MFDKHRNDIISHALSEYPREACGVIYKDAYVPLANVARDPINEFGFSDADTLRYSKDPGFEAVVHSHPAAEKEGIKRSRLSPSAVDMQQQLATAKPWVIVAENASNGTWEMFDWGKHTLDLPILERPFRHGVEDCYTVIQKWFWQNRGEMLLSMPRDELWWGNKDVAPKADLYVDHFAACGAERIFPRTPADLKPGDVFLFKLGQGVTRYNHGGVFLGNGLVAHHPPTKLSLTGSIGARFSRIDFWLRKEETAPSTA